MEKAQLQALAKEMIESVRGHVSRAIAGLSPRIELLEEAVRKASTADPAAMLTAVRGAVAEAMAALPAPAQGAPGKDADPAEIAAQVSKALAALPKPKDGAPGQDGKDGASVDPAMVAEMVAGDVSKAVAALPKPKDGAPGQDGKDGASVHPDTVAVMVMEHVEKAMAKLALPKDGRDGEDGKDAAQIDPLPSIDESKSYQRGTLASHAGGLIRAVRNTDPVKDGRLEDAGWRVVWDGVAALEVKQAEDMRTFSVQLDLTSGLRRAFDFKLPVILYREVWREGEYERGDVVTWSGSAWHCQHKTTDKPGTSEAWRLMVKRGSDGKDGTGGSSPPAAPLVRVK